MSMQDLPEDAEILAYSLSEIAAEKVVALLDPARNEPRDLYDIWFLTSNGHIDLRDLIACDGEEMGIPEEETRRRPRGS